MVFDKPPRLRLGAAPGDGRHRHAVPPQRQPVVAGARAADEHQFRNCRCGRRFERNNCPVAAAGSPGSALGASVLRSVIPSFSGGARRARGSAVPRIARQQNGDRQLLNPAQHLQAHRAMNGPADQPANSTITVIGVTIIIPLASQVW